jgi:hypothetical protein
MFQYESISARNGSATNSGVKRRAAENSETNSILKGEKRDMVIWSSKKKDSQKNIGSPATRTGSFATKIMVEPIRWIWADPGIGYTAASFFQFDEGK